MREKEKKAPTQNDDKQHQTCAAGFGKCAWQAVRASWLMSWRDEHNIKQT